MSGGSLDYGYFKVNMIYEQIEEELRPKDPNEKDWYSPDPDYEWPEPASRPILMEAIWQLKTASIYAKRIEWYLSGDDSLESLQSRLKEELEELENEKKEYYANMSKSEVSEKTS